MPKRLTGSVGVNKQAYFTWRKLTKTHKIFFYYDLNFIPMTDVIHVDCEVTHGTDTCHRMNAQIVCEWLSQHFKKEAVQIIVSNKQVWFGEVSKRFLALMCISPFWEEVLTVAWRLGCQFSNDQRGWHVRPAAEDRLTSTSRHHQDWIL